MDLDISFNKGLDIDIVICLDASAGMACSMDAVKQNLINSFVDKLLDYYDTNEKEVEQYRIKIITFRSFTCDEVPMQESAFYTVPDQLDELTRYIDSIEAKGEAGAGVNALEAVSLAIQSDWVSANYRFRHIIVVISNSPVVTLGENADAPLYPANMPKDLCQLSAWWEGIEPAPAGNYQPRAGRLIAFVPNISPWIDISVWNNYWPAYCPEGGNVGEAVAEIKWFNKVT